MHHDFLELSDLRVVTPSKKRIHVHVFGGLFGFGRGRFGRLWGFSNGRFGRLTDLGGIRSLSHALVFRLCALVYKSLPQRLRKTSFVARVHELVALFFLGTRRIGIGNANIPESVFGEHDAEWRSDCRLQSLARFQDFHVQLFACSKRRILHDTIKDDSRSLCGILNAGLRTIRRFLSQGGNCRKQNDNASIELQQTSRI